MSKSEQITLILRPVEDGKWWLVTSSTHRGLVCQMPSARLAAATAIDLIDALANGKPDPRWTDGALAVAKKTRRNRKTKLTPSLLKRLGTAPDSQVAKEFNVSRVRCSLWRKEHGIKAFQPQTRRRKAKK